MATTDTDVSQLVINKLTKQQYDAIATKSPTELYAVTDVPAVDVMTGATAGTAGTSGTVPAPAAGDNTKFLAGDGTWQTVSGGSSVTTLYWDGQSLYKDALFQTLATFQDVDGAFTNGVLKVSDGSGQVYLGTAYKNDSFIAVTNADSYNGIHLILFENPDMTSWNSTRVRFHDFFGASSSAAGTHGFVPAPAAGDQDKFLRGDGTWQALMNAFYPVGSIYMSATLSTAAAVEAALGGTWVAWGAGRVPVGVDANDTDFDTAEETGGEKTHTLSTGEIPAHTHGSKSLTGSFGGVLFDDGTAMSATGICSMSDKRARSWSGSDGNASKTVNINATHTHDSVGSGQAHNNLQPYITCYMYKRTA